MKKPNHQFKQSLTDQFPNTTTAGDKERKHAGNALDI